MSLRRIKEEILQDHQRNNYMKANLMPLRDKYDVSKEKQREFKHIAEKLTKDPDFPYEVVFWLQGNTVKMGYKPL